MKNTYELEFWDGDVLRSYLNFGELYFARKFFDAVIGDAKYKWLNTNKIRVPRLDGMTVFSLYLTEIVEYEYTKAEKDWKLPAPYPNMAVRLIKGEKSGSPDRQGIPVNAQNCPRFTPPGKKRQDSADDVQSTPARSSRKLGDSARSSAARKGIPYTKTLANICEELNLEPRQARSILRKHKIAKPYEWEDADDIVKLLKKEK